MLVTQCLEYNVNILASPSIIENISAIFEDMPFDCYQCQNITDVFMIPCFITIFDGHILTKNNRDIDIWECYLCEWSGKRKKCKRCRSHNECFKEIPPGTDLDIGPEYKAPVILLNSDKRERDVEGLIALLPPMPVGNPFSHELEEWIKSTCLAWHKKALRWREEHEKWSNIQNQKYLYKKEPKTYAEMAREKWEDKKISITLPTPVFKKTFGRSKK